MRYIARQGGSHEGGLNTWWVEDTEKFTTTVSPQTEVAATFWGWVHPDPEGAAKAEAETLNELNEQGEHGHLPTTR